MKIKYILTIGAWLAGTCCASAQTNGAVALMQRGLFEEEANRQLDAAIDDYKQVIEQFDHERQLAATAIFRLAECYRKEGRTNEANAQYQRILREFPDQSDLARLSQACLPARANGAPEISALPSDEEKFLRQVQESVQDSPDLMNNDLLTAAQSGYVTAAEFLIEHGTNLNLGAPLVIAAQVGNEAMVRLLLSRGAKVDSRGADGSTALSYAAQQGFLAVCRTLVAAGADVNAYDNAGFYTPFLTAIQNKQLEVVKFLITNNAAINVKNRIGATPLCLAIENGTLDIVKLLLAHHADANMESSNNRPSSQATPLEGAILTRRPELVRLLLENKADPNPVPSSSSASGETPLTLALAMQNSVELMPLLLEHGAKIDATNVQGLTALNYAIRQRNLEAVRILLDHGADANMADKDGRPPLAQVGNGTSGTDGRHAAGYYDELAKLNGTAETNRQIDRQIEALLIKAGADVNYERRRGIWLGDRSGKPEKMEFVCLTNTINHFKLTELLAAVYRTPGVPFPDFSRLVIHRLEGPRDALLPVDFSAVFSSGDCSKDMALQPADALEIPESEHKVADYWGGLSDKDCDTLEKCLFRWVRIITKEATNDIALAPEVGSERTKASGMPFYPPRPLFGAPTPPQLPSGNVLAECLKGRKADAMVGSLWLYEVVHNSAVLLNTWDLSQVQLMRGNLNMTFDLTANRPEIELEDGDVIHVKEIGENTPANR